MANDEMTEQVSLCQVVLLQGHEWFELVINDFFQNNLWTPDDALDPSVCTWK
jgi:hypothetical protein